MSRVDALNARAPWSTHRGRAFPGKNPGRLKATEAAHLVRGLAIFPAGLPAGASDFNDMHQAAGTDAVRELIETALQAAETPAPSRTPDRTTKTAPAGRERAARGDADEGASGAPRFDAFRVDADALWFDPPDDGSGGAARPVKVCGPLHVAALARDAHDNGAAPAWSGIACPTCSAPRRARVSVNAPACGC